MKKVFALMVIAGIFAACGNGETKVNSSDSTKADSTLNAMKDSAKSMMDTAKKMMDTASAKVSAVADSAKKAIEKK